VASRPDLPTVTVRSILARLFAPLAFGTHRRAARTFASFARAEEGSRRDLLLAAAATESTERAALYLRHAEDEGRHARCFVARSREHDAAARSTAVRSFDADVEKLFAGLGETLFVAFAHRGEARGRAQFEAYRDYFAARGDDETARMFATIIEDEQRHERYTGELLRSLVGGESAARRLLRRAALWEAGRSFRRTGRETAQVLFFVVATVLYVASAPLALLTRLLRPVRRGFVPPER
jgi:rubrerythrin